MQRSAAIFFRCTVLSRHSCTFDILWLNIDDMINLSFVGHLKYQHMSENMLQQIFKHKLLLFLKSSTCFWAKGMFVVFVYLCVYNGKSAPKNDLRSCNCWGFPQGCGSSTLVDSAEESFFYYSHDDIGVRVLSDAILCLRSQLSKKEILG